MSQPAPLSVFRNRSFSLMWTGRLVSTFGDSLTQLAAGILVYRLTGSVLSVGLMLAVTALPSLLFGLVAGVYVDRWDRKKILVASSALQAGFVALIPLLLPYGVVWLYVLVALSSTVRQFFEPAHDSVLPDVADEAALGAANSLMAVSATASSILGFAAAGFLAARIDLPLIFLLDALTFVVTGLLLLGLRVPPQGSEEAGVRTVLGDMRAGLGLLFGSPLLRSLFLLGVGFSLTIGVHNTLGLPFVLTELRGGSEFVFGVQESVMAAGFVLGSSLMAAFAARLRERSWIMLCFLVMGLAGLVYALIDSVPLALALSALVGVFNSPAVIAIKTLFQRHTPAKLRGRVFGAYYVGLDAVFVVGILIGGLGDLLGVRLLFAVGALLTLALGALAAALPGLEPQTEHSEGMVAETA